MCIRDRPNLSHRPLSPSEATEALLKFRALYAKPSDLRHLLDSRADPNADLKSDQISPLRIVLMMAAPEYVADMRTMLLEYGADESEDDRKRWIVRSRSDECEERRQNDYHNTSSEFDPCSANVEMNM